MSKSYSSSIKSMENRPSSATGVGVFFAICWVVISIIQGEPLHFIIFGGLNLGVMILTRISAKKNNKMDSEGRIFGFLVLWTITYFIFAQKDALIQEINFRLNEVMVIYLIIAFLTWFLISPQKTTQQIIFNLSPELSEYVLSLWKFSILFLLIVNLDELKSLNEIAVVFFLAIGFFELFIFYGNQLTLDYVDIILNPVKLLGSVLAGVSESFKWVILPLIFIILDQMDLNIWTAALIVTAIFVGIISVITSITKISLNSGLIESRVQEGKTVIPSIMNEVRTISSTDNLSDFNEFYQIPEDIQIQKKKEKITLREGNVLVRVPFSNELQSKTGIFLFYLNMQQMKKRRTKKKRERKTKTKTVQVYTISRGSEKKVQKKFEHTSKEINFNLSGSSIHRIPWQDWDKLQSKLLSISKHDFIEQLGYKNTEEFDKKFSKAIQRTVQVQEQIRSRIRGVPAPSFDASKFESVLSDNSITIPENLQAKLNLKNDEGIELIEGKGEYLFYVRKILKKDES